MMFMSMGFQISANLAVPLFPGGFEARDWWKLYWVGRHVEKSEETRNSKIWRAMEPGRPQIFSSTWTWFWEKHITLHHQTSPHSAQYFLIFFLLDTTFSFWDEHGITCPNWVILYFSFRISMSSVILFMSTVSSAQRALLFKWLVKVLIASSCHIFQDHLAILRK